MLGHIISCLNIIIYSLILNVRISKYQTEICCCILFVLHRTWQKIWWTFHEAPSTLDLIAKFLYLVSKREKIELRTVEKRVLFCTFQNYRGYGYGNFEFWFFVLISWWYILRTSSLYKAITFFEVWFLGICTKIRVGHWTKQGNSTWK